MADFERGPYPEDWSQAAKDFWDGEPNTYRDLYDSAEEWQDLQEAFDRGWVQTGISRDEHEQGRQDFYEISGTQESSFDWDAFREYLHSIGS